jgi:hypothetical protein
MIGHFKWGIFRFAAGLGHDGLSAIVAFGAAKDAARRIAIRGCAVQVVQFGLA